MDIRLRFVSVTTRYIVVTCIRSPLWVPACISFPISTRNAEQTFAGIVLCFIISLPFVVFTLFGLKHARVFFKFSLSNISFWILKLFVFPAVAHFLGKELVEEKPSEVRTVYILGSTL